MIGKLLDNMAMFHAPRPERVLVVAPHPDDESVGCGGYLAMLADQGTEITVLFVTDGGLDARGRQDHSLAEQRRTESRAAMGVLGVRHGLWWGLPDGHVAECCPSVDALKQIVIERGVELVLTPHPDESHPDHVAVAKLVAGITFIANGELTVMTYEIWTPQVPDCVIDATLLMERKLQAVRAYESQRNRFNLEGLVEGLGRYRAAWSRMRGWRFAEGFRRFDLAGYRALYHAN